MDVRLPDGTIIQNVPDNITKADLVSRLKAGGMAVPAEWMETTTKNNNLASQLGLTVRAGAKAVSALPALGADAIGGALNKVQDLTLGEGRGFRFQQSLPALDALMDRIGLPTPDTPLQRTVSKGLELGIGAGATAKATQKAAQGATGVVKEVLTRLSDDIPTQVGAGMGAGLAGQQSAESGSGQVNQFFSAMLGGLGGAGVVGGVRAAANALTPRAALQPVEIERRITVALERQGIDPSTIPPAMKKALMEDVRAALKKGGQLDDAALARLADYRRLNMTPTRGRLTLDPYDVTREQNAMKVAAATGARDAQLPTIAQNNNARLLDTVEGFNPVNDPYLTGSRVMAPILGRDAQMNATQRAAYNQANSMGGGDIPLPRGVLNGLFGELERQRKLRFLPSEVSATINDILSDTRAPFDVNTLDTLKTTIATAQRGTTDGNIKAALKIARDYLDNVPLMPDKRPFGGNQLVTQPQAMFMRQQDSAAGELMDALNRARGLHREWRTWQESQPGIEAALNGAAPETFIRNQIINPNVSVDQVRPLAQEVAHSPAAIEAIRSQIVQHLKSKAIGTGNLNETANFSGRNWLSALEGIGDRKLSLFFNREELETLKSIGRVGAIETFQPRGSAVNNSNTAAGMAGLLQGIGKNIGPVVNKIPGGQAVVTPALDNLTLSVMERGATNARSGLLRPEPPRGGLLDPLLLPAITGGGLLTAQ